MTSSAAAGLLRATLFAVGLNTLPAFAIECPIDHVVFRDKATGSEFRAARVAVNFMYLCGSKIVRSAAPRSDLAKCRGPYGDTIVEGMLGGAPVLAVYSVETAVPCCSWSSFRKTDASSPKLKSWLATTDAPKVKLFDEWMTIEGSRETPLAGPLANGSFVPSACRP